LLFVAKSRFMSIKKNLSEIRAAAGRKGGFNKRGKRNAKTIEKEKITKKMNDRILEITDSLINSQVSIAKGIQVLYRIDPLYKTVKGKRVKIGNKKPKIVTDDDEIVAYLNKLNGNEDDGYDMDLDAYYFLTKQRPDNKALQALLDRAHGKAKESLDIQNPDGSLNKPMVVYLPAPKERFGN